MLLLIYVGRMMLRRVSKSSVRNTLARPIAGSAAATLSSTSVEVICPPELSITSSTVWRAFVILYPAFFRRSICELIHLFLDKLYPADYRYPIIETLYH